MTKLSALFMAATAALTPVLSGSMPAWASSSDRDTDARGGMLGGVQTPSISQKGSFVHRGKAIVWVPNETLEQNRPQESLAATPSQVVGRETGSESPRVRAATARGAFVQSGKTTIWLTSEDLAERMRSASPSGRPFGLQSRVVLLGGAEVHRDLLTNLSDSYVMESGTMTQPPAVTKEGAFVHRGKTIRWVPNTDSGPMLGQ
jgi:hypothetical protein